MENDREGQGRGSAGFGTGSSGFGTTGGQSDLDRTSGTEDFGTESPRPGFSQTGTRSGFADSAGVGTGTGFGGSEGDPGTRAGSYDRKFYEGEGEGEGLKERVGEKLDEGKERVGNAVHSGKNRVADQLHRVGERLEERARHMDEVGGVQRRAGQVAHRASEALDSSADYLRNHEIDEMRDDLENAIRERPLLAVGIAAGAGFLLARILRD